VFGGKKAKRRSEKSAFFVSVQQHRIKTSFLAGVFAGKDFFLAKVL
jgi:hypothetical protein